MSAKNKRERSASKRNLNNYLGENTAPTVTVQNKTPKSVTIDYPQWRHACKLDHINWEPYRNGKVLSIGKCIELDLKKAA